MLSRLAVEMKTCVPAAVAELVLVRPTMCHFIAMLFLLCVSRAAYTDQQLGITSPILGVRLIDLCRSHETDSSYAVEHEYHRRY